MAHRSGEGQARGQPRQPHLWALGTFVGIGTHQGWDGVVAHEWCYVPAKLWPQTGQGMAGGRVFNMPLQTWLGKEVAPDMIQVSLGYCCTPCMLVAWSPSCSHWYFARWVWLFSDYCLTPNPDMRSVWEQGLTAVESYESQFESQIFILHHIDASCIYDWTVKKMVVFLHMCGILLPQPEECKSSFVTAQSFYTEEGVKAIVSGIFCCIKNNSLFIYTSTIFALESIKITESFHAALPKSLNQVS